MRRLLVVITAFLAFGPLGVAAQEATPTTVEPAAGLTPTRTDTRYVWRSRRTA